MFAEKYSRDIFAHESNGPVLMLVILSSGGALPLFPSPALSHCLFCFAFAIGIQWDGARPWQSKDTSATEKNPPRLMGDQPVAPGVGLTVPAS